MKKSVVLKKDKEHPFIHKNLWIFSGAIDSYPKDFVNGDIYAVESSDGKFLGYGYFNQNSSLAGRFISFEKGDPLLSIKRSIAEAIHLRKELFSNNNTNAFRLINGEGDGLPGLIVDNYNGFLVLQSHTLGIDRLKDPIVTYLTELFDVKGIYEKSLSPSRQEEDLKPFQGQIYKERKDETVILENHHPFYVSWEKGQKTGFFLDQRENRKLIESLSFQKRVLNCFCYTGGFSIYAHKGKAAQVRSIDASKEALEFLKKNYSLNDISIQEEEIVCDDVFAYLSQNSLAYDLVILDPPALVKKRKDLQAAIRAYYQLHYLTFKHLKNRAFVLTCSCSHFFGEEELKKVIFKAAIETNKKVKILQNHLQAMDHPINIFHKESQYLKSFLLEVYD